MLEDKWVRVDRFLRSHVGSFKGKPQGWEVPQLVKGLPNMYIALGYIPGLGKGEVQLACLLTIQRK